ncbi:MAG: 2-oxo acid dehydrogenase subunit E2 [Trueperaceae bacterium]|nr:2-oxo acid dehydrogenase subunit E2 [Trueperaceae bacterium]
MPELGEGISGGTVVNILVAQGDKVEVDQSVIELETDKAVVEVPSNVSGVVESINVKNGDEAKVGQTILTLSGAAAPAASAQKQEAKAETKATAAPAKTEERSSPRPETKSAERKLVPAAPSVRRLAREMGVDIAEINGSGILGRISAGDVRQFAQGAPVTSQPSAAPALPKVELPDFSKWGQVERVPMSGIRKATVRSMTQAWSTVPMVTHFDKADSTEFENLRKRYKPKAEAAGASLTPTAMLLKIAAAALKKFPDFNASIDTEANEIIYKSYVHIGVAVDTPNGLLVPVIKDADRKNIIDLAKELGELAAKARDRKLSPDDMQGGNFNISNLGGIGGTGFTPIVNPPQVAILGVSRGSYEPVYNKETGNFDARMMMPLSLTYDHRLIDGAAAARFLRWVCEAIEEPFLMALEG